MTNIKPREAHRSKEQICIDVLMAIRSYENKKGIGIGGIGFTKILYIARCSSNQLKNHLANLIDCGLITRLNVGRDVAASITTDPRKSRPGRRGDTWHITTKGINYLNMVDEINRMG
ncbi:MAG: hypothetical protein ACRD8Z_16080, partial [Nitrososphaeraceae archaeon]